MYPLILASSFDDSAHLLPQVFTNLGLDHTNISILTITTAANPYGTPNPWMEEEISALTTQHLNLTRYDITDKSAAELTKAFTTHDVIFFIGGNTFYLLEQIQKTNAAKILTEALNSGKTFMGSSAGSIIAAPDIAYILPMEDTPCPALKGTQGLNLTKHCTVPHMNNSEMGKIGQDIIKNPNNAALKFLPLQDHQIALISFNNAKIIS